MGAANGGCWLTFQVPWILLLRFLTLPSMHIMPVQPEFGYFDITTGNAYCC